MCVKKILLTHDGVWQMLASEIIVKDYSSQHAFWKMKNMSGLFSFRTLYITQFNKEFKGIYKLRCVSNPSEVNKSVK